MMDKIKKVASVKVGAADNQKTINDLRVSVGNLSSKGYAEPKSSGIKIRGTGAATKGTTARGPMA
jgi:hypothetical protein